MPPGGAHHNIHRGIMNTTNPLWICPKCRRKFAIRNQWHSCGRYTVRDYLKNKSPQAIALYRRFVALVKKCGPVIVVPVKTRISFQVRMNFAAVDRLNNSSLYAHVVLARPHKNPRFSKVESFSPRNHVHHFLIRSLEELDDEVLSWLKEAYEVGEQKHQMDVK